jgi:hypothetical protein
MSYTHVSDTLRLYGGNEGAEISRFLRAVQAITLSG